MPGGNMSHAVKLKSSIVCLRALKAALKPFGWSLTGPGKIRTYSTDPVKTKMFDHVAVNPNDRSSSYDIGISLEESGEYSLTYDTFGGEIPACFGKDHNRLLIEYSKQVILQYASEYGAQITSIVTNDNNSVELTLEVGE